MIKRINKFYEPVDHDILTTASEPTMLFKASEIKQVIEDLIDTAKEWHPGCIGLSANQIWDDKNRAAPRIFIMVDSEDGEDWIVFQDAFIKGSGPKKKTNEGCMSFKNLKRIVKHKRDKNVEISYLNEKNQFAAEKYTYPQSMIIQHEMDHMVGKVV